MARTTYYGTAFGTTSLELYWETDGGVRYSHRVMRDQAAYDAWHLAGYLNEVLTARNLRQDPTLTFAQLLRPEKHLLLYLLLAAHSGLRRVMELGSSLFEIVDGLELVHEYFRRSPAGAPGPDPARLAYGGVELSPLCAAASLALHPCADLTVFGDVTRVSGSWDVLYDRIVAGAAFETAPEAAAFFNRFRAVLLNLFVSTGETFVCPMVGRAFTYLSLQELLNHLDRPLYHLFGTKAPRAPGEYSADVPVPVVEGFFLIAEPGLVDAWLGLARRIPEVAAFFTAKSISPRDARALLP
ncbi:MAG: hypothetical protein AB1635_00990 [Acidobacteriota bacterium]